MKHALSFSLIVLAGCAAKQAAPASDTEAAVQQFITAHVEKVKPLAKAENEGWWQSSITGSEEAFARRQEAEKAINDLYSNRDDFAHIKAWRESGQVTEPILARQLDILYRAYLPKQVDKDLLDKMVKLGAEVEQVFNTHRAMVNGKELTENEVRNILTASTSSDEVKAVWEAYYAVGPKVDPKLRELIALRNESAHKLGYESYYHMALDSQEFGVEELLGIFDELDELTRKPFMEAKARIDAALAAKFEIPADQLRHWHYQDLFFQEAPPIFDVDLDAIYKPVKLEEVVATYYAGIDLDAADILARGDLYEKEGKSPHAFCIDMDREGDVRILTNLQSDARWADTLLHELGHGVYDKYIDRQLPWLLRSPAHILTTEGVAMLFGRMAKSGDWMAQMLGLEPDKARAAGDTARKLMRLEALVFSRWAQVMVRFEHGMYTNPDQDLSKLWWDLKQKYQGITPPAERTAPDYAAKIHIVVAPVYYHNYQLGALFASQVHRHIAKEVLGGADPFATSYVGKPEVGKYFRAKVFGPAARLAWREMVKQATGEDLTAKHFAADFIDD